MKIFYRALFIFPVVFLCQYSANAQVNIGTVRFAEIVTEMPEYKTVESQVESAQKVYQDTIQRYQANLEQEMTTFRQQQGVYPPEKKVEEEQRINQLYQRALEYQNAHLGPGGTIAQYTQTLLQPLEKQVINAIRTVAQQKRLAIVFNEQGALYVDQSVDITLDVQLYLKNAR
ncbi:MAG: OmpH family outer membrane protein [Chlorobi bacterium]|nr:OmpH family outer membrane protein [Chlorobiota bacterium]